MTDVGVDVFAEWGVVPEDVVALSVSPFSSCRGFVAQSVVVSAFVECFLVWVSSLSTDKVSFDQATPPPYQNGRAT